MKHPPSHKAKPSSSTMINGVGFKLDNRYKVLGLLGRGSFGTVAAGLDKKTGKKVAIKHIYPIANSRSEARHILREVTIMRLLRWHPNIISLEEIWVNSSSSTLCIVMELMECDLQRILASGQVLTSEHVKVLLKQLLLGVQTMHRHGIIHRDLKPANVLVLSDCQLRITDFGLARLARRPSEDEIEEGSESSLNLTGYVITRWYRAPEVMLGPAGGYSVSVDMWSVGCILGELLGCRGALFPGKDYIDQVSVTLATLGIPDTVSNDALGYELSDDALQFLRTVKPRKGRSLESLVPPNVDKEALHLLKELLVMNTKLRPTATRALDHDFLSDCPVLPTAADSNGDGSADEFVAGLGAIDFSFENGKPTLEELRKRIAAEAALYNDKRRELPEHTEGTCCETNQNLTPTPSLQGVLGVVRTQARQDKKNENRAGARSEVGTVDARCVAGGRVLDKRFSSMANVANAEDGGVHGLNGSPESTDPSHRELASKTSESAIDSECSFKHKRLEDERRQRGAKDDDKLANTAATEACDVILLCRHDESAEVAEGRGDQGEEEATGEIERDENVNADEHRHEGVLSQVFDKGTTSQDERSKDQKHAEGARQREGVVETTSLEACITHVHEDEQGKRESTRKHLHGAHLGGIRENRPGIPIGRTAKAAELEGACEGRCSTREVPEQPAPCLASASPNEDSLQHDGGDQRQDTMMQETAQGEHGSTCEGLNSGAPPDSNRSVTAVRDNGTEVAVVEDESDQPREIAGSDPFNNGCKTTRVDKSNKREERKSEVTEIPDSGEPDRNASDPAGRTDDTKPVAFVCDNGDAIGPQVSEELANPQIDGVGKETRWDGNRLEAVGNRETRSSKGHLVDDASARVDEVATRPRQETLDSEGGLKDSCNMPWLPAKDETCTNQELPERARPNEIAEKSTETAAANDGAKAHVDSKDSNGMAAVTIGCRGEGLEGEGRNARAYDVDRQNMREEMTTERGTEGEAGLTAFEHQRAAETSGDNCRPTILEHASDAGLNIEGVKNPANGEGREPAGETLPTTSVDTVNVEATNRGALSHCCVSDREDGARRGRFSRQENPNNQAAARIQAKGHRRAPCHPVLKAGDGNCQYCAHIGVATHNRRCEEERAASIIQKTQRRAVAIRHAWVLESAPCREKQCLFVPGWQHTDQVGDNKSWSNNEAGQQKRREQGSSLSFAENEEQRRKTCAAVKIQSHARRRAVSRRTANARQKNPCSSVSSLDSRAASERRRTPKHVPILPISSSAGASPTKVRNVHSKIPREPLAILRQLRDGPTPQPKKSKTDRFRFHATVRSAIEAHIAKTGAMRRKAHPLPTPPCWRPTAISVKLKLHQQQRTASRIPLMKRRVVSPLHRSVQHVNSSISATSKRRGLSVGPRKVQDRLNRAADFAADLLVRREYAGQERRNEDCGAGGSATDKFADDVVICAPIVVCCTSPT